MMVCNCAKMVDGVRVCNNGVCKCAEEEEDPFPPPVRHRSATPTRLISFWFSNICFSFNNSTVQKTKI